MVKKSKISVALMKKRRDDRFMKTLETMLDQLKEKDKQLNSIITLANDLMGKESLMIQRFMERLDNNDKMFQKSLETVSKQTTDVYKKRDNLHSNLFIQLFKAHENLTTLIQENTNKYCDIIRNSINPDGNSHQCDIRNYVGIKSHYEYVRVYHSDKLSELHFFVDKRCISLEDRDHEFSTLQRDRSITWLMTLSCSNAYYTIDRLKGYIDKWAGPTTVDSIHQRKVIIKDEFDFKLLIDFVDYEKSVNCSGACTDRGDGNDDDDENKPPPDPTAEDASAD
jgi:hypothetical protein